MCTDPLVSPQRNIGQYGAPYCFWEVQLFPPRVDHINIARENAYDSVTTEATAEVGVFESPLPQRDDRKLHAFTSKSPQSSSVEAEHTRCSDS